MTFEEKFGFAVAIASAEVTKYTAQHGPAEIAKVIKDCFDAVEKAEDLCRGSPSMRVI